MSYEDNLNRQIDASLKFDIFDDDRLNKLLTQLEKKVGVYRPDIEDFREIYGDEYIDRIKEEVRILEEKWREELLKKSKNEQEIELKTKKISTIVEYIVINQLSGSWLNSPNMDYEVIASPTAKPDDYGITNKFKKGFDLVLEFSAKDEDMERNPFYGGISLDVTIADNRKVVLKKLAGILRIISSGEAPNIKFFESASGEMGEISVAPFIFVFSKKSIEDLLTKEFYSKEKHKEALDNDPIQLSLLSQIDKQAEVFLALSKKFNNKVLEEYYRSVLEYVNKLFHEKNKFYQSIVSVEYLGEKNKELSTLTSALSAILHFDPHYKKRRKRISRKNSE